MISKRPSRNFGFLLTFIALLATFFSQPAHSHTVSEILSKMQESQGSIRTLQADMKTTIRSSSKNIPPIEQQGKIFTQTPDKSRVEMLSPIRQITITNGNKMKVVDQASGKSSVHDLSVVKGGTMPQGAGPMDPVKALEQFDLKITKDTGDEIILEGKPKNKGVELGRMTFTLSPVHYLPTRIILYGKDGKQLSESTVRYARISEIYVPIENEATVTIPKGSMKINVKFENVSVNKAIPESQFRIE